MRELRSENSWMHNAPLLMRGEREQRARMHVDDAAEANIVDGDTVRITSENGQIELPVTVTKDIMAGVIALPHGLGHDGSGGGGEGPNPGGGGNNPPPAPE